MTELDWIDFDWAAFQCSLNGKYDDVGLLINLLKIWELQQWVIKTRAAADWIDGQQHYSAATKTLLQEKISHINELIQWVANMPTTAHNVSTHSDSCSKNATDIVVLRSANAIDSTMPVSDGGSAENDEDSCSPDDYPQMLTVESVPPAYTDCSCEGDKWNPVLGSCYGTSCSTTSFPTVLVPKDDDNLRQCINYRGRDGIGTTNYHPFLPLDNMIEQLRGSTVFTRITLQGTVNIFNG